MLTRAALVPVLASALVLAACGSGGERAEDAPVTTGGTSGTAAAGVEIGVRPTDATGNTGTFTMSGAMEDSGTFTTVDNRDEGGLDRTFHGEKGELELHVRLLRVGPGVTEFAWSVRSGTGEYAAAEGEGEGVHQVIGGELEGALTGTLER